MLTCWTATVLDGNGFPLPVDVLEGDGLPLPVVVLDGDDLPLPVCELDGDGLPLPVVVLDGDGLLLDVVAGTLLTRTLMTWTSVDLLDGDGAGQRRPLAVGRQAGR